MDSLEILQKRIRGSKIYECKDKNKRLYFNFMSGSRYVKISTWFEIVNDHIKAFAKVENYRSENLLDHNQEANIVADIESQFNEIINECEKERKKIPLNDRLKDDILPVYDSSSLKHQVNALRFLCSMKVSALYADTGTGKSKIAIDLCISRYEAGEIKKVLVFLPVSTKSNFMKQIGIWCKEKRIEWKLIGSESMGSSEKAVFEALDYVDNDTQIIIDESHSIKTPTAKRSKRIDKVCEKTSYKIVMTGTPVTDNVHNLYMQYKVLSPMIIGLRDWKKFEEMYLVMGGRLGDEIIAYKNIDYLMGLLEPYTFQVTKEECMNLPAKKEYTHICDMTDDQSYYYECEKENLLEKIKGDDFKVTDIFQSFTRMQQICCGYYRDENGILHTISTHKIEKLNDIPLNEQTIFFCKYLFEIDMMIDYLGEDRCAIFTGKNLKERDNELDDFVNGRKQYFVATMQSGGTGLNGLQEVCRRIVFFSNSFSYFHRKQSIGRIDRQGQTKEMYIHDVITSSKIDFRIMANLERKGNLADEIRSIMHDKTELKKYVQNFL